MNVSVRLVAALFVPIFPAFVSAHGLRSGAVAVPAYYFYRAPVVPVAAYSPVYYVTPAAAVPWCVPAAVPVSPSAIPSAAPPSGGPEIPRVDESTTREPPRVTASLYYAADEEKADRTAPKVSDGLCWVGFWNESDRDVVLTVDSQSHPLARGQHIIIKLNRQFTWQVQGEPLKREHVPENRLTRVIVIGR